MKFPSPCQLLPSPPCTEDANATKNRREMLLLCATRVVVPLSVISQSNWVNKYGSDMLVCVPKKDVISYKIKSREPYRLDEFVRGEGMMHFNSHSIYHCCSQYF